MSASFHTLSTTTSTPFNPSQGIVDAKIGEDEKHDVKKPTGESIQSMARRSFEEKTAKAKVQNASHPSIISKFKKFAFLGRQKTDPIISAPAPAAAAPTPSHKKIAPPLLQTTVIVRSDLPASSSAPPLYPTLYNKCKARPVEEELLWEKIAQEIRLDRIQVKSLQYPRETKYTTLLQEHTEAKRFLETFLPLCNSTFSVIRADQNKISQCKPHPLLISQKEMAMNPLSKVVFSSGTTHGTGCDIFADGRADRQPDGKNAIKVTTVCSQYNLSEARDKKHPTPPGEALKVYLEDATQGPDAQLAFQRAQIELINIAAQIGYNALIPLLDDETKQFVVHGYFEPDTSDSAKLQKCIEQLKQKGHMIEYAMIGGIPSDGKNMVYQFLVSAPNMRQGRFSEKIPSGKERDQIEYLCLLYAILAQFSACISLARQHTQPVDLDLAGIGLSAFGNSPENFIKAFYAAGKACEEDLKINNVHVSFKVYTNEQGENPISTYVRDSLKLQTKS